MSVELATPVSVGAESVSRRWRLARLMTLVLGAIPFAIVVIAWIYASAHQPTGAWQYAVPKIGPTLHALRVDLFSSSQVWSAVATTLEETALGLLIATAAGILIGVPIGLVRVVEIMFYPLIVVLQSVPQVALAPLLVLIFGYGIGSKVALAATLAFFPILVNVVQGMKTVRLDELDLLRSLGASRWQTFTRLRLPRAFPSIFAGIQVGLLFGLLGAVVAELLSGSGEGTGGLGLLLTLRTQQVDIPGSFSVLIVLSVIAMLLTLLVSASNRLLTNWQES